MIQFKASDGVVALGVLIVCGGAALIYPPAGAILFGAFVAFVGYNLKD